MNWKDKSLQLKPVKSNLIRLLNNLKSNMIKDTFFLRNGNKSLKPFPEEMMILTESDKILPI
jgi:hypothetical protein